MSASKQQPLVVAPVSPEIYEMIIDMMVRMTLDRLAHPGEADAPAKPASDVRARARSSKTVF